MEIVTTIRSYILTRRLLGVVLVALPFLNTIFDWIGKLETAKNIPGYLIEFSHWFSAHQDWIRPVFVLAGIFFIVWDERKRNDARYLSVDQVDSLTSKLEFTTWRDASNEGLAALSREDDKLKDKLKAIATLAYIERNSDVLAKALSKYDRTWVEFNNWATNPQVDWKTLPMNSVAERLAVIDDLYKHLQKLALDLYGYKWNQAIYNDTPIWPEVPHIPTEHQRQMYKQAWLENHIKAALQIHHFYYEFLEVKKNAALSILRDLSVPQGSKHQPVSGDWSAIIEKRLGEQRGEPIIK